MNSALRYRVQAPMIDSLLSDIGVDGSNIAKSSVFRDASDMNRAVNEAKRANAGKSDKPADKPEGKK